LSSPKKFASLQFLDSAQGIPGPTWNAQLNFSDSTSTTLSNVTDPDWTQNGNNARTSVGLVGRTASWSGFYTGTLNLFEHDFTLSPGDQAKVLNSIKLTRTGGGILMFFALSGPAVVTGPTITATGSPLPALSATYGTASPDKILLMIGSNDINLGYDMPNAPARLSTLITHIYGYRPNVKLFVASIIPMVGHEPDVQAFNATIPGIVASHQALGRNVVYVPMYETMNINTDLADGLHPNALGYQHMAQAWDTALHPNYSTWASAHGVTGGKDAVGPDGISNLLLYALDLKLDGTNGSPGTLTAKLLGFTKRAEAVANGDVTYTIETSPDLQNPWTTGTPDVNDGTTISYTLPTGENKIFARLKVTSP